jgi:pimeloyl-ACP methyl ester carboxylesterase
MIETVIVAHGLFMPGTETRLLRHRLQKAGFRPLLFQFPSVRGTLAQNVERLARFAADAAGDRLHFIGYSLGGVVTLHMLLRHRLNRVGRIVCMGSPLTGCRTASWLMQSEFSRGIVGRSLADHSDAGGLSRWDLEYELGIIAGSRSLGVGRLFGQLPEPNDGTVAVDETRLPGATAHITLPVTHTQLMFDRVAARQAANFLRTGAFMR